MKWLLSCGSQGGLRSDAGLGCLVSNAFSVLRLSAAGVSSEQMSRIAALKFPASSLLVTAAANLLWSVVFLVAALRVCCALSAGTGCLSQVATLLLITLLKFLFTPPRLGFAKIAGPKLSNSLSTLTCCWARRLFAEVSQSAVLCMLVWLRDGCD